MALGRGDFVASEGKPLKGGSPAPIEMAVTGPLTDAELRFEPVDITATTLPLPTGASTAAKQDTGNTSLGLIQAKTDNLDVLLSTRLKPADTLAAVTAITNVVHIDDNGGSITVDGTVAVSGTVAVTGPLTDAQLRASAVPISAASLPLPSGAATAANQATEIASLANLDVALSTRLKPADTLTAVTTLGTITNVVHVDDNGGSLTVDGAVAVSGSVAVTGPLTDAQLRASAVPVSAASLPLPSGAATSANQATEIASLANLDVALSTRLKPADTLTAVTTLGTITNVVHIDDNSGSITVDGTVAISGSVAVTGPLTDAQLRASAVPISAASLPLPSGASTAAKQPALGTAGTASADVITVQGIASMTALKVDGSAVTQPVSGTVTANAGTNLNTSLLALEAGGNLASIKAKTDNLDVALSTRLKPADTLTAVTTLGTITNVVHVDDNSGSLTVDNAGTFAVQATVAAGATNIAKAEDVAFADADVGVPAMAIRKATPVNTSGADGDYEMLQVSAGRLWTSSVIDTALPTGTNVIGHVIVDSAPTTAVTGPLTDAQLRASAVPVSAASLPLPSGAATSAKQDTGNTSLANLDVLLSTRLKPADTLTAVTTVGTITNVVHVDDNAGSLTVDGTVAISGSVAVTGPLTDAQLRASAVPISAASLPLPSGASTAAKQPALGTAGTASADVISIQGITGMTPISITGSIAASSTAKATALDPTYTEGDTTAAFSQDLTGHLRVLLSALVHDNPSSPVDGSVSNLSLTKQGRLRVATYPDQLDVNFFSASEEHMWGTLETNFTFAGSPWSVW